MKRKWICLPLFLGMLLWGLPTLASSGTHTPPEDGEIQAVFAIDQENQTYHPIAAAEWEKVRSELTLEVQPATEDTAAKDKGGFCFELYDGTRVLYTVTESQVLEGDTPLTASIFQRGNLEQLSRSLCRQYPAQPAMFAYMNPEKAVKLTVKGYGATGRRVDPEKPLDFTVTSQTDGNLIKNFAQTLRTLEVAPQSTEFDTEIPRPDSNNQTLFASLEFQTGVRYDMVFTDTQLLLRSSDGVRTYRYSLQSNGSEPIWEIREDLWEVYAKEASCVKAAVFLTKTETRERTAGTFYSMADGGDAPLAQLSRVVDRILAAYPKPTMLPAGNTIVELYVQLGDNGKTMRFELDNSLNAYYVNDAGRGVSAAISQEDWETVRGLVSGKGGTEQLMLVEKDGNYSPALIFLEADESYLTALFAPLPKDPAHMPYNTGPKPDYAVNGLHCWIGRGGGLTETTVYPTALVQESNLLPWTPANYEVEELYQLLDRNL